MCTKKQHMTSSFKEKKDHSNESSIFLEKAYRTTGRASYGLFVRNEQKARQTGEGNHIYVAEALLTQENDN